MAEAILWLSAQMKEQYGLQVLVDAKDNLNRLDSHIRILLFQAMGYVVILFWGLIALGQQRRPVFSSVVSQSVAQESAGNK